LAFGRADASTEYSPLTRSLSAVPFENIPAEESASQGQKCFMDVGSFLITDAQPPKLVDPSERPLDDPTPSAQSAAMRGVALG
jgi:hypothetical protein